MYTLRNMPIPISPCARARGHRSPRGAAARTHLTALTAAAAAALAALLAVALAFDSKSFEWNCAARLPSSWGSPCSSGDPSGRAGACVKG